LAAVAAGVVLALSIPPFGFWPLAFVGTAALYALVLGQRARTRFWLGWTCGVGMFAIAMNWSTNFSDPGYVALTVFEALAFGLAALAVPPRGVVRRALAFPAALTLAEALRDRWPFGGLPVGGLFLGQATSPLGQFARVSGELGVELAIGIGGVVLAEALLALGARRAKRPSLAHRRGVVAVLAGLVLVAAVVAGELAPSGGPVVGTITTALVQGGGKRGLRAIEVNPMIPYHAQLAASAAIRPGSVQLVVWPEDVVGLSRPLAGSPEERQLADLARHLHATLIAGVTQPKGRHHFLNYVEAWSPTGKEIGRYEKVHRVPFGEYVPMRWLFKHLANLSDVPRNAIPGKKPGFLRTPAGPLGIMISYETFFPHRGRVAVQAGGEVLLVPTNDASYRGAQMPTMEVAASELRAIEEGRNLVQVAPTGYTAVITNRGRLLVRSVLGQRSVIETTLPERRGRTVFNEIGSDPVIGLGLVLLVAAWAAEWSSRRRRAIGAQA